MAQCDKQLLDKYLKDLCFQMSVVLKRQRGDAYNFGDNPDSEELVSKQLPTEDLERAPTHTKDIENLFGIQDSILTRFGAQVFNKSTDDLIIKYSQDLLGNKYEWNTSKMKKKAREMDKVQQEFDAKQKSLIEAGVAPADAILMTSENKIQRVVDQCRRSHGGPVSEESEVENILGKFVDDKGKISALRLEIRFRKFTVLNIKENNPLFKQQNLSVDQLTSNLRLLLQKTDLALASTATMADLEKVLSGEPQHETESQDSEQGIPVDQNLSVWPPKIGEHIVVNFEDGWYIGEVQTDEENEEVLVSYMKLKKVATADAEEHPRRFWVWPATREILSTKQIHILPVRPDIALAKPPSTRRILIFSVDNAEIIDKFAD